MLLTIKRQISALAYYRFMKRAIIVGTGSMGSFWCRTFRDSKAAEVVACVDTNLASAEKAVEDHGFQALATDDLGRAIREAQADFVVDVTPSAYHCEVTIRALEAGLHVLGEKPMADSMEEARRMVAASEKAGKLYMVSQSRRYDARIVAYRDAVRRLQNPGILKSDFFIGAHFTGYRLEMASPLILDMAIHTFDAARFVSERDAVSVYCEAYNPSWSWMKSGSSANALFEMEGGLRYTYCGSWVADGKPTSWESEWRAQGSNGSARWNGDDAPLLDVVSGGSGLIPDAETTVVEPPREFVGGIHGALLDFLDALETGKTPNGECHDNIKSLAMVFAALESAETGKRVWLRDI